MAEKAEKKAEAKESSSAPAGGHDEKKAGKGGMLSSLPVVIGGVTLLEAVVLFAGFKFLGSGAHSSQGAELATQPAGEGGDAHGEHGGGAAPVKKGKIAEVPLAKLTATNSRKGRTVLYDVRICVQTKSEHEDAMKGLAKDREATIRDRIRTIIAQSDPEKLGGGSEPGLETLRRQVKYQLDEIVGEGMIEEVLITDCTPIRSDL
jgi:flagellar basal body-associated protein FliL